MVSGRCEDQKENSLSHANRKKHKTIIIKYLNNLMKKKIRAAYGNKTRFEVGRTKRICNSL